jgi:hypothetical protein
MVRTGPQPLKAGDRLTASDEARMRDIGLFTELPSKALNKSTDAPVPGPWERTNFPGYVLMESDLMLVEYRRVET